MSLIGLWLSNQQTTDDFKGGSLDNFRIEKVEISWQVTKVFGGICAMDCFSLLCKIQVDSTGKQQFKCLNCCISFPQRACLISEVLKTVELYCQEISWHMISQSSELSFIVNDTFRK